MAADGDVRAPGAAITVALCGHWEHEPPCPLAPHHTDVRRAGDQIRLRVLFATEPATEAEVRRRIEAALSQPSLTGPQAGSCAVPNPASCALTKPSTLSNSSTPEAPAVLG